MDLYTIYESDEVKISIFTIIHEFFNSRIRRIPLEKNQFYILLSSTLALLKKKGEVIENKKIKSSSEIPIIKKDKPLILCESFDIFEQGFGILSCVGSDCSLQVCVEGIEEIYALDEHFCFHIFSKSFFGVHGFFALVKEDEILIAFFTLDELKD